MLRWHGTALCESVEVRHRSKFTTEIVVWVCLKMLCTPLYPMVLLIIIPIKWLLLGIYPIFRQTHMFIRKGVVSAKKKTTCWGYLLDVILLFLVFITPFVSKLNHFGCLKLVNCLQFGLLFASIVSRFGYTMGICLPFVCFDGETKKTKNKQICQLVGRPE